MSEIDWLAIKTEYINTKTSYLKLSNKYSISFATMRARAKKEDWVNQKKAHQHEISIAVAKKTRDKIVEKEVNRIERTLALSDKLMEKTEKAIEQIESILADGEIVDTGMVDTYRLRQIVASLKDIKDIQSTGIDDNSSGELEKLIKGLKQDG